MINPSGNCDNCPLRDRLKGGHFVKGKVSKGARVAILGEAPGTYEVEKGEPFVGPSGALLDSMLRKAGVRRDSVTISNVLHCQPLGNKLPESKGELYKAIECCRPIMEEEMKGAEIIIGLGNIALKAMTGDTGVMSKRGSVYAINDDVTFIPTIHPSALLRQRFMSSHSDNKMIPVEIVESDIKKAVSIKKGWQLEEDFRYNPSSQEIEDWLLLAKKEKAWIAFDIETNRGHPSQIIPIIISFALTYQPSPVICFDFEGHLTEIVSILGNNIPKITHNGIFDVHVMENVGIPVKNWLFDTMYSHHLLYAELPHKLGFVQSVYTNSEYHKDMLKDEMIEVWDK